MATHTAIWFSLLLAVCYACDSRDYGNGGTVCVCSKKNCDTIPQVTRLSNGQYEMYTSSLEGARFNRSAGTFSNTSSSSTNATLTINRYKQYQKIYGFGGAFTDSAGINILSLSNETQKTLMNAYFSEEGVQYSMGRIPIAGTDFSTRGYTYDDVDKDYSLQFFSLQVEDVSYKIPLIQQALNLTKNDFKLYASAWTAPAWMKTNGHLSGIGFLNLSMYEVWANYHIKFLDAYRENGIELWGLTTGNEPANGFLELITINDMAWVPDQQSQWIRENLGPKIRLSDYYSDIKIMIVDDQRVYFPSVPNAILKNEETRQYVDGMGVHYYTDKYVDADVLSRTHFNFPDKFILATEACEGSEARKSVILGSWDRAESYLKSIIDDLNNWSTGWMDWNIALNTEGGPTYVGNYVDSPIIVNATADEFYKQPMYYALGHFSKFLRPESVRVKSTFTGPDLEHVVFIRPDGGIVVSIFNPTDDDVSIIVEDVSMKNNMKLKIPPRSMNSVVYW